MNVTESGFKNRQLHMEDYLQMVSAEQKEYAEVFDYSKITEKSGVITDWSYVKNVGKPCEGEPHARFDEGERGRMPSNLLYKTFGGFFFISMFLGKDPLYV